MLGGYRKAGGCTTTGFALAGLTTSDPWVEFPLETIVEFLIAHVNSGVKMANELAWKQKLPDMQKGARWSRVFGSLSAAMASLMDAGFETPSIHHWIDPSGAEWHIDFSESVFVPAVREVLQYFLSLEFGIERKTIFLDPQWGSGLTSDLANPESGKQRSSRSGKSSTSWRPSCKDLWTYMLKLPLLPTTKGLSGANGVELQCMNLLGCNFLGSVSIFFGAQRQRSSKASH